MDAPARAAGEKPGGKKRWIFLALIAVLLAAVVVLVVLLARNAAKDGEDAGSQAAPKIGYAEGVTILDDQAALQAAVDEMNKTAEGSIALRYKNDAVSSDGITFACFIDNSESNTDDFYLDIFADAALTDEIYLSGLIPPGAVLRELTLNRALEAGSHTVYVVYTSVAEEDGEQVLTGQVSVTMNFIVNGS